MGAYLEFTVCLSALRTNCSLDGTDDSQPKGTRLESSSPIAGLHFRPSRSDNAGGCFRQPSHVFYVGTCTYTSNRGQGTTHPLPHHSSTVCHCAATAVQGNARLAGNPPPVADSVPRALANQCRQDPAREGARRGGERACERGADEDGAETGAAAAAGLRRRSLEAAGRHIGTEVRVCSSCLACGC